MDHERFNEISNAQWLWYHHNIMKDEEEAFIDQRSLFEYLASFINPDAVAKTKEMRDNEVKVPDEDFETGISNMFGRDINLSKAERPKATEKHTADIKKIIEKYNEKQKDRNVKLDTKGLDYKHWLEVL